MMMRNICQTIVGLCFLLVSLPSGAVETVQESQHQNSQAQESQSKGIDVQELVFGHINDDYSWHITNINDKPIAIPLPVIVHSSERGWFVFLSSRFHHGHEAYQGFQISHNEGGNKGKVVELVNGVELRPLDISISKNVTSLLIGSALILWIFLSIARRYKKNPLRKPTGLQAILEPLILTLDIDISKACIGKNYARFSPYILTAFFFILINNALGVIPIFPGGANLTGNITITFVLAFTTFFITNVFGTKEYWKEVFWPEVPTWLKCPIPLMPLIEIIGLFTKPIALMIRLFANMLSGHIMALVLIALIFIFSTMSKYVGASVSVISVALVVFMTLLEVLVCFIQAYVFATLSALFIGLSQVESHHKQLKRVES
ncbi:ATP synthase subunit a [Bacteroidia bacterium]|nr:ATP synthase subunit a [Bacteroidia bacterium]